MEQWCHLQRYESNSGREACTTGVQFDHIGYKQSLRHFGGYVQGTGIARSAGIEMDDKIAQREGAQRKM